MYLLSGFKSYTFRTYMNVQRKSPCWSVRRVCQFFYRFSINSVLNFLNQEISTYFIRNIFEAIEKSFLTMYKNKTSTKMLVIVNIFITKKPLKWNLEIFFYEPYLATTTPLKSKWQTLNWIKSMSCFAKIYSNVSDRSTGKNI